MSRTLSTLARSSMMAQETGEVWLVLLTLAHPSLAQPLRFVNDMVDLVSGGDTYIAFPFEIEFAAQSADDVGEARLTIDNVDREIVRAIRSLDSPVSVSIDVVLASQPSTVEVSVSDMVLRDVTYDAVSVSGVLRHENLVTEPLTLQMTPQRLPGLF